MSAPEGTAPLSLTDDPITWGNKVVVIDVAPWAVARHPAKIVDVDQWTVLATWRPGGLPDLLSHCVFERTTGYGRELRGARLYNVAPKQEAAA